MSFDKNLEIARKAMNFSRKEMAIKLGISLSAYSNYENGSREPNFNILREISYLLNVSTDYLLDVDATIRQAHFYNLGKDFMRDIGFEYIVNPFDIYGYAKFDLYFAMDENDLSNIVAFKKSHFIELIETPQKFLPEYNSDKARIFLLGDYTEKFLAYEGSYDEWLDDLNYVVSKTKEKHPEIYAVNLKYAHELTKPAFAKGYTTRQEADLAIKASADLRLLINERINHDINAYIPK